MNHKVEVKSGRSYAWGTYHRAVCTAKGCKYRSKKVAFEGYAEADGMQHEKSKNRQHAAP